MFEDRFQAGRKLADLLFSYKNDPAAVILALPRGGVEIGSEISKILKLPLDVVMVRKIGHAYHPEYAIGAIAEGQKAIYNEREATLFEQKWLKQAEKKALDLIKKRIELYFGSETRRINIKDKTAIIVDDGIATGFTMGIAVKAVKDKGAKKVIVAVPVAPADSIKRLEGLTDEVIVGENPEDFLGAVGSHYYNFDQVSDDEVKTLLKSAKSN